MKASIKQRDDEIAKLEEQIYEISNVFKECFFKKGRGALIVYTSLINSGHKLSHIDYNTKSQSIDLFDNKNSRQDLRRLIDNYDPQTEGIMILINNSHDNDTWFITVKLKSMNKH